jgi:adenylylsulfate kinase
VMGLPGAGKSTLAYALAERIGAVHLDADAIRSRYNDWDFTVEGRLRQASRMKYLSDGIEMNGGIAIADFIAPTVKAREGYEADVIVWMDTIKEGRFEDTNKLFEPPENADIIIKSFDYDIKEIECLIGKNLQRKC